MKWFSMKWEKDKKDIKSFFLYFSPKNSVSKGEIIFQENIHPCKSLFTNTRWTNLFLLLTICIEQLEVELGFLDLLPQLKESSYRVYSVKYHFM